MTGAEIDPAVPPTLSALPDAGQEDGDDTPQRERAPTPGSALRRLGALMGLFVLAGFWAVLQLWGLDKAPFHTKGEPREALVVREIVDRGDWILPRRNGIELPAKPPLFHWLGAITARVTGRADEQTIRLPSALLSGASALAVFATGTTLWGPTAALVASLSLLASFEWVRSATSARVDMTLTAGLTFAFVGLLRFRLHGGRRWMIVAYAGSAWAVLSKGPVGLALPLLQVIAMCLVDRRPAFARQLRIVRGVLAVVLIGGAWYALAFVKGGEAFITKQILTENVWRFLGTAQFTEGHRHSVAYLLLVLLAGCLPWTLLLPSVGASLWRDRQSLSRQDPRVFSIVWIVIVFGFYALATSKRGVYLLALYPALSLLLGWWVAHLRTGADRPRWLPRIMPPVAWGVAATCAVLALVAVAERGRFPVLAASAGLVGRASANEIAPVTAMVTAHAALLGILFAMAALAAVATALSARAQRWGLTVAALLLTVSPIIVAVRQAILPAVARAATREVFADSAVRVFGGSKDLLSYRRFDYGMVFYWGTNIPVYDEHLSASGPRHLVVAESDWAAVGAMERSWYERIPGVASRGGGNLGPLVLAQRVTAAPSRAATPDAGGGAPP